MGPVTSARVNIELRRVSGAEYFPYVGTAMTRPQPKRPSSESSALRICEAADAYNCRLAAPAAVKMPGGR